MSEPENWERLDLRANRVITRNWINLAMSIVLAVVVGGLGLAMWSTSHAMAFVDITLATAVAVVAAFSLVNLIKAMRLRAEVRSAMRKGVQP